MHKEISNAELLILEYLWEKRNSCHLFRDYGILS